MSVEEKERMNTPTRQEFDELKAEVAKLREQRQTEPISLTDSALLQTLVVMAGTQATDIGVLKQTAIRTEQKLDATVLLAQRAEASLNELRQVVERRFDAIAEVQKLILARLPEKGE